MRGAERGGRYGRPGRSVTLQWPERKFEYYAITDDEWSLRGADQPGRYSGAVESLVELRRTDKIGMRFIHDGYFLDRDDNNHATFRSYYFQRHLVGYQTVTVPAGKFYAPRVDYAFVLVEDRKKPTVTSSCEWLVAGLGVVKSASPGRPSMLLESHRVDFDGLGNLCGEDDDNDGVVDWLDNYVLRANASPLDTDSPGVGDVCQKQGASCGCGFTSVSPQARCGARTSAPETAGILRCAPRRCNDSRSIKLKCK